MHLYAFPFAGGGEHCYKELSPFLHAVLQTQALPGRGRLFGQSCITRVEPMVDYLLERLNTQLDKPYALFGHSMGAFVAYMLARRISTDADANPRIRKPSFLVLSGRKAPSVVEDEIKHLMPSTQFRNMLLDMGGIPEVVWQDNELMALFEPVIRADFELLETYQYQQRQPLDIPLYLFLGRDDNVSHSHAQAWQQESAQPVTIEYFDGGHFYFQDSWSCLGAKINAITRLNL